MVALRWLLMSLAVAVGCDGSIGFVPAPGATDGLPPGAGDGSEAGEGAPAGPAPVVRIESPARGAFLDAASTSGIEVTGTVVEGRAVEVRVNGALADLAADGTFRFVDAEPKFGVHHLRVEAEDASGRVGSGGLSVLYGTFEPAETRVPDALVARVGPSVISDIALSVRDLVSGVDLEAMVKAQNPVASDWWGTLTVESLSRGRIRVELDPTTAGLRLVVGIANVDVDLHNDAPGPWNQDGWARADEAILDGIVDVWATDAGGVGARLVESSVELDGFDFDVAGIEGESLVRGIVGDLIRDKLEQMVRERVPPLIEDTLSALDLSRQIEVRGAMLDLDVGLGAVEVDSTGLELRADASLTADENAVVPRAPGTLRTPSEAPALGSDRLVASFADDMLDQVLSAAWSAGMLDLEVPVSSGSGPVTVSLLTLILPALSGLAPDDAPVIATTDPLLPPIVTLDAESATLSIGELHVILEADTDAGRVPLVTVALKIDAGLAASFDDGQVTLSLLGLWFDADPVDSPAGFPEGRELEDLLQSVVDMMAPDLEGTLTSVSLPALAGIRLAACDAAADGAAADYLTIACDTEHE
ncbi:MAG: hypothetical protein HYY06_02100 [Deltaproteobacteria bacterium]|nr:hypothetical protein [Deltaproteobacteria bacterium]